MTIDQPAAAIHIWHRGLWPPPPGAGLPGSSTQGLRKRSLNRSQSIWFDDHTAGVAHSVGGRSSPDSLVVDLSNHLESDADARQRASSIGRHKLAKASAASWNNAIA